MATVPEDAKSGPSSSQTLANQARTINGAFGCHWDLTSSQRLQGDGSKVTAPITTLYTLGFSNQVWTKFLTDISILSQSRSWQLLEPKAALSARPGETCLYILSLDNKVWTKFLSDANSPGYSIS
jgi:flagellar biosynthesis regulator FlaF